MTTFHNWLKITGQFSKKNEDQKPSHLLLSGGILYVNDDILNIFNEKYSDALKRDEDIYLVECRKDVFNLFFDLDFLLDKNYEDKIKLEVFINIIKHINDCIYDFYNKYYKCIVTTTTDKIVKKIVKKKKENYKNSDDDDDDDDNDNGEEEEEKEFIKKGFHLHYPDIKTNKSYALEIRKAIIRILNKNYKELFVNSFSDIVDEHVFVSSGLRLTGSKKGHFVSQTKEFINEGRPYNLHLVFDNNNNINEDLYKEFNDDIKLLIDNTTIISKTHDITNILNNPNLECEDCDENDDNEENENIHSTGSWIMLDKKSTLYNEICRFFKINGPKQYSVNDIKRIFYTDNKNVYIIWTKSRYCLNIDKNHNSCGVYFKLTKDGLCQKCYCKCDTLEGRKYGYCKDYSSTLIACTTHIAKLLNFKIKPDKTVINKNVNIKNKDELDDFRELLYNQFTQKTPIRQKKR